MQVVLPDPFGPTSPRISPGFSSKVSPSSARKSPKRFTSPSTARSGGAAADGSGDIDASPAGQRDQPVGQEQHERHDQHAVDELKILRRRDPDRVVDPVEDDDAEQRPDDGRGPAEQREDDREDADA